jgi:anti-sigma regulatory factor (Ser/Thr protein kinase)
MDEEYRMVIPGVLSKVPEVCDFVVSVARKVGLDDRAAYHCQMAVDEACTNIIEHGYGRNGQVGRIEIIWRQWSATIRIVDDSPCLTRMHK